MYQRPGKFKKSPCRRMTHFTGSPSLPTERRPRDLHRSRPARTDRTGTNVTSPLSVEHRRTLEETQLRPSGPPVRAAGDVPRGLGRDRLAVRVREPSAGGDGGIVMASKDNLHRETLRAALRIIQTAETLEQARIQLARMLNVFDKLEAKGIKGDAAVAEAEERLMITQAPKTSAADERPVRRRGPG